MNYQLPRVQIVPQADDQVAFQVDGQERLRWHAAPRYPRPFFFPLVGPSGRSVIRMGHPAAPDHGHHRAFWWGHQNIGGVNFWEERGGSQQVRQEDWIHYQDGAEEAGIVVKIGWFDQHKTKLLQQELIAVYRPLDKGESWLELQTTFTSPLETLPIGKTNFGFLGLRVAASMSTHYGGGQLTSGEGAVGEKDLFGKQAKWVDYSGPIVGQTWEGVTWCDHPSNPNYPTSWHVREDGWMSAAFCLREGYELRKGQALTLRHGFHIHAGPVVAKTADQQQQAFAAARKWEVVKVDRPWRVALRRLEGK